MQKNKFGICEWALPVSGPLAIQLASQIGFEGIQISDNGGSKMAFPLNNPNVQKSYIQTAKDYNVILHSLNLGALLQEGSIMHPSDTLFGKSARRSLEKAVLACHDMDIPSIVCTVSPNTVSEYENSLEHLKYACSLASVYGVQVVLESILPLEKILNLLEKCPHLQICLDILNPLRFGTGDPCEQIVKFGRENIHHFHMKDSIQSLFSPTERGCVLLGNGDVQFNTVVNTIKDIGYNGWFISENYYYYSPMNGDGDTDFMELARVDLKTLERVLK